MTNYSTDMARIKCLRNAIKSGTPLNDLYALVAEKDRRAFKQFARRFGFSEKDVRDALHAEKKRGGGC